MSIWIIYLLVMIPSIKQMIGESLTPAGIALIVIGGILTATTLASAILQYLGDGATKKETPSTGEKIKPSPTAWTYLRRAGYAYALAALVFVTLPSERQMYVMAGAYAVTNIEGISKLPENAVGAANAWLERLSQAATADGDVATAQQIQQAIAAPVK